jgi:hypothetical protein
MRLDLSLIIIMAASRLIYSRAFTSIAIPARRPPSFQVSSSHFRDADSPSSYDALKDELASGSDSGGETSASASTASSSDAKGLLRKVVGRAFSTLDAASTAKAEDDAEVVVERQVEKKHVDKRTYLSNPNVTPTALAHSLWKETILPGVDTVIDATCGNGKDSVALAEMLFDQHSDYGDDKDDGREELLQPELLCIDIQSRAAANTTEALRGVLDSETFENNVRILGGTSHAPLPQPRNSQSVGLICYNLGWLPGSSADDKSAFATKVVTTMYSLTDAALLLRVGGLLSIMTYPGTTPLEASAVKYFAEGLAMLTTRDKAGWQGYIDNIPPDADGSGATSVRDAVRTCLERVAKTGIPKQTWRAYEHKPLGRPLSPILITAMRIK